MRGTKIAALMHIMLVIILVRSRESARHADATRDQHLEKASARPGLKFWVDNKTELLEVVDLEWRFKESGAQGFPI